MAKVQWANPIKGFNGKELKVNEGTQSAPDLKNFTYGMAALNALAFVDMSAQGQPEKLSFKEQLRRGRLQEAIYNAEQAVEPMQFSSEDRTLVKELIGKTNGVGFGPIVALRFEEFFEGTSGENAVENAANAA